MASSYQPEDSGLTADLLGAVADSPALLAAVNQAIESRLSDLEILTHLRRQWPAQLARAALVMVQMSHRALAGKFKLLRRRVPFFYAVPEALEQATPLSAALHKAATFARVAPAGALVVDIGCGVGGDAIALARAFPLLAVELSPARSWMAHRNLHMLSLRHLVVQADFNQLAMHLPSSTLLHADPARRTGGKRGSSQYFPGIECIASIAATCSLAAIKVSPAADFAALPAAPLELIAVDDHVVEATLWLGRGRDALRLQDRTATLIGDEFKWRLTGSAASIQTVSDTVGPFVFETAGVVTRAGLAATLLKAVGLSPLSADGCYATGPHVIEHPALRAFEVLNVGTFDMTRLRRILMGLPEDKPAAVRPQLEVKTRGGLGLNTDSLQRKLAPYVKQSAALIIYRSGRGVMALVTRRVDTGRWTCDRWMDINAVRRFTAEMGTMCAPENI